MLVIFLALVLCTYAHDMKFTHANKMSALPVFSLLLFIYLFIFLVALRGWLRIDTSSGFTLTDSISSLKKHGFHQSPETTGEEC